MADDDKDYENEYYDKFRKLTVTIRSWYYHKQVGEHEQETTNDFITAEEGPFDNTREEWIVEATKTAIDKLTDTVIAEFSVKGITKPAGDNDGSIDWDYKILNVDFDYKPGKPPEEEKKKKEEEEKKKKEEEEKKKKEEEEKKKKEEERKDTIARIAKLEEAKKKVDPSVSAVLQYEIDELKEKLKEEKKVTKPMGPFDAAMLDYFKRHLIRAKRERDEELIEILQKKIDEIEDKYK